MHRITSVQQIVSVDQQQQRLRYSGHDRETLSTTNPPCPAAQQIEWANRQTVQSFQPNPTLSSSS
ncbi:MAG: hypothetical protein AAFP90_10225, partial [Planctomycetota bacterium]